MHRSIGSDRPPELRSELAAMPQHDRRLRCGRIWMGGLAIADRGSIVAPERR
jgi:hypothetical protein